MNNIKLVKDLNGIHEQFVTCFDTDSDIGFEFNGTWITNPFYDETLRFEVDPVQHYGEENIKRFVKCVVERMQGDSHELD